MPVMPEVLMVGNSDMVHMWFGYMSIHNNN